MPILFLALAATSPLPQQLSDGDAIVALAWERRRRDSDDPANACVEIDARTMADQIRSPDLTFRHILGADDASTRPNPVRLRRIAKGEGKTLDFDVTRLGLPVRSPACKFRYFVAAPVVLDNYAYVHVGVTCDFLCGHGEILLLERRDATWRVVEPLVEWDS